MINTSSFDVRVNIKTNIANDNIINKKKEMHQEHFSWFESTTPEEERILNKIYEFEEKYFSDMTLKNYERELTTYREKVNGEWETSYSDLLGGEKLSLVNNNWLFKIAKIFKGNLNQTVKYPIGWKGVCHRKERLIEISDLNKDDDSILLHEMIHAYESMLRPHESYHQFVLIKLHEKLLTKIPKLTKIMRWDLHTENRVFHTPLFLLKSLDLDIRLNQPLGTVYDYNREINFRKFNPYSVKYRHINIDPPGEYHEINRQWRFATVGEAKDFILEYHKARMEEGERKMVGFFPELGRPKPIEYYVFKRNDNNKYTILKKTIKEEEINY